MKIVDPKDVFIPPKPWSDYAEETWGWNFVACLEYNPPDKFKAEDIASVIEIKEGDSESYGEGEYEWRIALNDGRSFLVEAWHDYTGWDCQSGAEYTLIEPAP